MTSNMIVSLVYASTAHIHSSCMDTHVDDSFFSLYVYINKSRDHMSEKK